MAKFNILDQLEIASPCTADWNEMSGDERTRFCGHCEKNVYDLTEMKEDEIFTLIADSNGNFCGRLYQRSDGKVLAEDCPVGLAAKLKHVARKTWLTFAMAAAAAASLITAAFLWKETSASEAIDGAHCQLTETVEQASLHMPAEVPANHSSPRVLPKRNKTKGKVAIKPKVRRKIQGGIIHRPKKSPLF